jgi:hypothetical protein
MARATFVVETVLFFSLLLLYMFNLMQVYKDLPESMAVHFSFSGDADGWCSPQTWAWLSILVLLAMGSYIPLELLASRNAAAIGIGGFIGFGICYSAFNQILKINTGRQDRISIVHIVLWGTALPAIVVAASTAIIHAHR